MMTSGSDVNEEVKEVKGKLCEKLIERLAGVGGRKL